MDVFIYIHRPTYTSIYEGMHVQLPKIAFNFFVNLN